MLTIFVQPTLNEDPIASLAFEFSPSTAQVHHQLLHHQLLHHQLLHHQLLHHQLLHHPQLDDPHLLIDPLPLDDVHQIKVVDHGSVPLLHS
jgi:hypothetical protein